MKLPHARIWVGFMLMAAAASGMAQIPDDAGWHNSSGWLAPDTNPPPASYSAGASGSSSYPEIAEAITPEIEELARGLDYDPKRIFDYVHDHIRHVLYFGSKKGAHLTLLERSGNDFDQCALLVALLRAAGHTASHQFGVLQMPYDHPDHQDLRHWLGLSLMNTNWPHTQAYFSSTLGSRGFPYLAYPDGTNTVAFHRVWVKLTVDSTTYYLDPAFKISEPIAGADLESVMGLDTNTLWSVAGGTATSDYAQNLNEASLRGKLGDYTSNLLAYLESNLPHASVEEVLGGRRIVSSSDSPLGESLPFTVYTAGGQLPVQDWDNQPTNLMTKLSLNFAGTNHQWLLPELQGQRLALTFSASGLAQVWQDDDLVLETTNTGSASRLSVAFGVDHPHGQWSLAQNALINTSFNDQTFAKTYQRTNATYDLVYGFEVSPQSLRARQLRLDRYRQQGLSDTSREVVSETLKIMGLNWLLQTHLANEILAEEYAMLNQQHHALGRMAQEKGRGYYIDVARLSGVTPSTGITTADAQRVYHAVDVMAYFDSALEHGLIEQMQTSGLVAASTVKMLQLGNTNGLRTFLAHSNNWGTVSSQLINYDLNGLYYYITNNYHLLLPANGAVNIAGPGSWGGYGVVTIGFPQGYRASGMLIGGGYFGGYDSDEDAEVDPNSADTDEYDPFSFDFNGPFNQTFFSLEPVDLASGAYVFDHTDLTVGGAAPRGLSFNRHYSSLRRHHNPAGMSPGWTHNFHCRVAGTSAPEMGLGRTTPSQMAPMLVATRAARELYSTQPDAKNWLLTALIAKWGVDNLISNAVSVVLGADTVQFIMQPDGTFTPPPNCTYTLLRTNNVFWLRERHGRTFKFDTNQRLTSITDPYDKALTIAYNGTGLPQTVTDWKGRSLTLNYSRTPTRLTSVADSTGRTVSFGYTTNAGRLDLASATDPENQTRTFTYDTNHQMVVLKDALNRVVASNVYDGFGRVIEQYSQGDTNQLWRFYWSGFENVEEDPTGAKRRFFFDEKVRPVGVENALGQRHYTLYDGQDHVVMTVSPLDEITRFEYDERHNLLRAIDPLGFTNRFEYDAQDRRVATVDARGNTNRFGYNARHQLVGQTNAAGDWISLAYHTTEGTLSTHTDPGGTTSYGYDTWGQLNSVSHPGGLGTETFLNSVRGDVTNHVNARNFATAFQYNQRRGLTNTIAPTNLTTRITYDGAGNVHTTTDARSHSTTNTWSATRKLLSTTLPATPQGVPVVSNVYDSRDLLARTIDPLQRLTVFTNDPAQRLISVTDPLLRTTQHGYDADGRRLATTNAASEVMRQEWSQRGEPIGTVDGATNIVGRAYDAAGNQVFLTNRNGKLWKFQYDAANRLTNTLTPLNRETRITYNDRGLVSTIREPSQQTTTNFYDVMGRLTNSTDAVASRTFRYDANSNVTNLVELGRTNAWTFDAYDRVNSYRDADGNLIQYRHDQSGNLTNLIYPGNRVVTYAYDSLNRLTNVTDWANRQTSLEYDLAGHLKRLTRPNGTVRTVDYDAAGQATNIVESTEGGTAPVALFRLNWNAAARIEWEFAAPLPHPWTPPTRVMTVDDDNRIATFNSQNVAHDLDGNLTSGPLTNSSFATYAYDARNRLTGAGGISYGYDPAGNRVSLTNGADVTKFVVNPNAPLSQVLMRIHGGVTNYYVHGAGLLYEVTETASTTNTLTYHYDYRGSTVALTDGTGAVTDRVEYSAYGQTSYRTGTNDTPFLFNGRYGVQTDANGLLYMRARYYNPYLCRFLNADPIGFEGGLNFYAYADGNPVSLMDPFGLGAIGEIGSGSWLNQQWQPCIECHGVSALGFSGNANSFAGLSTLPGMGPYDGRYAYEGYQELQFFTQFSLGIATAFSGYASQLFAARAGITGVTSGEASALARQIFAIEVNGQRAVSSVEAFGSRAGSTFRGRGPLPTSDLDIRITLSDPANFGAVNAEMAEIEALFQSIKGFPLQSTYVIPGLPPPNLLQTPFIPLTP